MIYDRQITIFEHYLSHIHIILCHEFNDKCRLNTDFYDTNQSNESF